MPLTENVHQHQIEKWATRFRNSLKSRFETFEEFLETEITNVCSLQHGNDVFRGPFDKTSQIDVEGLGDATSCLSGSISDARQSNDRTEENAAEFQVDETELEATEMACDDIRCSVKPLKNVTVLPSNFTVDTQAASTGMSCDAGSRSVSPAMNLAVPHRKIDAQVWYDVVEQKRVLCSPTVSSTLQEDVETPLCLSDVHVEDDMASGPGIEASTKRAKSEHHGYFSIRDSSITVQCVGDDIKSITNPIVRATAQTTFNHDVSVRTLLRPDRARLQISYEVHPSFMAVSSRQLVPASPISTRSASYFQFSIRNMGIQLGSTVSTKNEISHGKHVIARLMLDPTDARSVVFDFVLVGLLLYDCATVPLLVFELPDVLILSLTAWFSRIVWTLAIPRAFITGYVKVDGTSEMEPKRVMKKYMQGWFWFDFTVVLFDWLTAHAMGDLIRVFKTQRFIWFLRPVRLARVLRVPSYFVGRITVTTSQIGALWMGMVWNTVFFIFVVHWLACLWYALGYQYSKAADIGDTWLHRMHLSQEDSFLTRYSHSVFWAIGNLNDGGPDAAASSNAERMFAVFTMFFCFIWSAAFISKITAALTRLQILTSQQGMQFNQLRMFLQGNNINGPLAYRVMTCAKHLVEEKSRHQHEGDVELLQIISEHLLIEIHYEIHCNALVIHPFFRNYNLREPLPMQMLCHSGVDVTYLAMGDVLFVEGQDPEVARMFFPLEGLLYYHKSSSTTDGDPCNLLNTIEPGTWLCEQVLWTKWTHVGTARAGTHCQVMRLSAQEFQRIVAEYQQEPHTSSYAQRFVLAMNEAVLMDDEVDDVASCIDAHKLAQQVFPVIARRAHIGSTRVSAQS